MGPPVDFVEDFSNFIRLIRHHTVGSFSMVSDVFFLLF